MGKTLYFGGPILTMDKSCPRAEAVLTENGKILAVGSVSQLQTRDAVPFDLQGAALMPGFVDGHSHMVSYGLALTGSCDLSGAKSFDDILGLLHAYREKNGLKNKEPISGRNYDPERLAEKRHPDAALLDRLGFDNPVACVHQSGHVAAYNTVAMERAGVLRPDYVCPSGGFAARDQNGKLTGYFEETAKAPFNALFAYQPDREQMEAAILAAQEVYLRHGFTTVQEGSANGRERIQALHRLGSEGKLLVDVVCYLGAKPGLADVRKELCQVYGKAYVNRVKLGGVKLFLDGSPQARTAWLRQPYEAEAVYAGYPTLTDDQVARQLSDAVREGLQPIAHCNGDAASEQFLRAWEHQLEQTPDAQAMRPVMIHAQTVGYDQLARMGKCRMAASFFIGHCDFWGDTHLRNLGSRGMRISPARTAQKEGVVFSLHQDCPVTPPDMLHSIWCAVNRLTGSGVPLESAERLEVYDALQAATLGGAYTYFEEDTKGILKPGAVADLVILSRDPTAVAPEDIRNIRVLKTIKEDRIVYEA